MTKQPALILTVLIALAAAGCGPNKRIMESTPGNRESGRDPNATVAPAGSTFEQDLEAMRTADFKFILVFRRKDGQQLDATDKELIGRNTALQANRRRLSDEGRAVIIGSNFPIETRLMNELTERFNMENLSRPDSGPVTFDPSPQPTHGIERR